MSKRFMLIRNNSKLWLTGFISFQYEKGKNGINPNIPAIIGVLNRLKEFESQIKKELISQYGQPDVDYAVREAVKHNKNNLAYIEGICKKPKEKESFKKSIDEARQKKSEQYKDLTPEESKSWSNLNLLEMAYSNKPETLPLKEISSG
jgi:DNA gyrase/topoisomerase IV subunit B